jgi:hypothetical protein
MRVSLRQTCFESQPHQRFLSKEKTLESRLPNQLRGLFFSKARALASRALDAEPTEVT